MTLFKERAENLSFEELSKVKVANNPLLYTLNDYFSNDSKIPLFLMGDKGKGKTFNTLKSLSSRVRNDRNFLPVMFIYEKQKKTEVLDPRILAEQIVWGPRYETLQKCSTQEDFMRASNALVRDDYHFIFEDVMKGKVSLDNVTKELKHLSEESEKGKKVLLISENLLSVYAEKLSKRMDTKELEDVLLKFGQMPYHRFGEDPSKWSEYEERNSYLSFREVPPLQKLDWIKLFEIYDVDADEDVKDFMFESNSRPRSFVKFSNLFENNGKVNISFDDMIMKSIDFLPSRVRSKSELLSYYYLLNFPKFLVEHGNLDINNKVISKNDEIKRTYEKLPILKKVCTALLSKNHSSTKLTLNSMNHLLRKWKEGSGISDDLSEIIYKNKSFEKAVSPRDVIDFLKSPVVVNFLSTFEILEGRGDKDVKRECLVEKLDEHVSEQGGLLEDEISDYVMHSYGGIGKGKTKNYVQPSYLAKSDAGRLQRIYGENLLLNKPFQVAFQDVLYEMPTLDILNLFSQSSLS